MTNILNLVAYQGANNSYEINATYANGLSINLDNFSANGGIRRHYESANVIYFDTSLYANGLLVFSLTESATQNVGVGRNVYDVTIINNSTNNHIKLQKGLFIMRPSVVY